jgi:hypothetical protein
MSCTEFLKVRVSPETKLQAKAAADREFLSEAAWLKRLVLREIRAWETARRGEGESSGAEDTLQSSSAPRPFRSSARPMLVRLKVEDKLLLDARAEARGMRPATYASVLLRSHLRELTPLPKDELLALKRSISMLGALGRNINQIAKVANRDGRLPESVDAAFRAMLTICTALRDHTKALLKANEKSWRTGDAQADL